MIKVGDKVRVYGFIEGAHGYLSSSYANGDEGTVIHINKTGLASISLVTNDPCSSVPFHVHIKQCRRLVRYRMCEECHGNSMLQGKSMIELQDDFGRKKTFEINCSVCNGKGKVEVKDE